MDDEIFGFDDRLHVKASGKKNRIADFVRLLRKTYPPNAINISPLIPNRGEVNSFRIYVNILYNTESFSTK